MHTRHPEIPITFESLTKTAREVAIVVLSALLVAAGLKLFLIPHQLLSGGVAGAASVIGYLTDPKYISLIYFGINLPILLWGLVAVGRKYIFLSMLCVACTTWFLTIIPQVKVTKDPILASIFGGVIIAGALASLCARAGRREDSIFWALSLRVKEMCRWERFCSLWTG